MNGSEVTQAPAFVFYSDLTRTLVLASGSGRAELEKQTAAVQGSGVRHYLLDIDGAGFWWDRILAEALAEMNARREGNGAE